jgi:hypothetical protein
MDQPAYPYCPISRQLCQEGRIYGKPETEEHLTYCAFWHQSENRCVFRMVEYDLFNIARALDEIRSR